MNNIRRKDIRTTTAAAILGRIKPLSMTPNV